MSKITLNNEKYCGIENYLGNQGASPNKFDMSKFERKNTSQGNIKVLKLRKSRKP